MTAPLEIEHLGKVVRTGFLGRPKTLLEDVSFGVADGAVVGFVGANGAGKSTTIRHVIGVARPTSGSVKLFGRDPTVAAHRAGLGFLPETTSFAQNLTPTMLLKQQATLAGRSMNNAELDKRLDHVGLAARGSDAVGKFSKGMRQRLGIAMALVGEPKLLVLDEPMSGLDPAGRDHVRTIIRTEAERGCSILFSSHVLADVEALSTHVVVINKGRVVFFGSTRDAVGDRTRGWEIDCVVKPGVDVGVVFGALAHRRVGGFYAVDIDVGADALAVAGQLRERGAEIVAVRSVEPRLEDRLLELMA